MQPGWEPNPWQNDVIFTARGYGFFLVWPLTVQWSGTGGTHSWKKRDHSLINPKICKFCQFVPINRTSIRCYLILAVNGAKNLTEILDFSCWEKSSKEYFIKSSSNSSTASAASGVIRANIFFLYSKNKKWLLIAAKQFFSEPHWSKNGILGYTEFQLALAYPLGVLNDL
jgi:hypothetical protein